MKVFLGLCVILLLLTSNIKAQTGQACDLYGSVFIEADPKNAFYNVFVEDSESAANLLVFQEENRLFADKKGIWFFTKSRGTANFTIYFVDDRRDADFSIFYTDIASFAGCQ